MIIWLASYPKSGNTWVRGFIISLLYTADGTSNLEDFKKINQYPLKSHFENLTSDFNDITKFKDIDVLNGYLEDSPIWN